MADTLKFGPEWLRQLSGGNSVSTPPPSPAPGFGKYKLADYRYGREEMLALYTSSDSMPEELQEFAPIITEKSQEPLALQPLTEEEQRIMSQSVNSQAVLRMMGRGAPPMRGRGAGIDRGRGRGRGRGEGYMQRGMSYDEMESGAGFGRARQRPDGSWDEMGQKPYPRPYNRFDENVPPNKVYQRSLSSENWRDRDEEDEDGDWRKAGGSKWSARGSWREGTRERGFEYDRGHPNAAQKGYNRQYQRSRSSESWEEEEMPEWSTDGDPDELGTFDASGAFVSQKFNLHKGRKLEEERESNEERKEQREKLSISPRSQNPQNTKEKKSSESASSEKDINENQTKPSDKDIIKVEKSKSPRTSPSPGRKSAQSCDTNKTRAEKVKTEKQKNPPVATVPSHSNKKETSTGRNQTEQRGPEKKGKETNSKKEDSNTSDIKKSDTEKKKQSATEVDKKVDTTNVPKDGKAASESNKREKLKSEAEALDQLQETVENMVAGITVLEDDEEEKVEVGQGGVATGPTLGALPQDHENYSKWFYRDPQGDLQGPFLPTEMAEWFSAGYFTMNLHVRRGCDDKFSPLGELIKRWGRVPFLPGPSPPPLMEAVSQPGEQPAAPPQATPTDPVQMQQVLGQLQENEAFKALPPLQQQQLAMQMLLKQPPTSIIPPQQQSPKKLSPRSSEVAPSTSSAINHPSSSYNRSYSTPNTSQGQSASIWDVEPSMMVPGMTAAELEAQLKEKLEQQEAERKYQERVERQKEELRKQQEEIQKQKEEIERERLEIERKKQDELKKLEEERKRAEEEKRKYEEEQRRKFEEEKRLREEEERRKLEEELRRQEIERQKELQKQQELQKQREAEEREKQRRAAELHRQQEEQEALKKQQQEALRKLQQEQLANMQLPSHAQWGSSGPAVVSQQGGKSLLEIQQQEEQERQNEMQRKQMELQRQQMLLYQQQQQQQQKSWSSAMSGNSTKSLLEIQQEQARQLERERQKREENQQQAAKNLSLGSASVWAGGPVNNWANEGAWGAIKNAQMNTNTNNGNSLGFWDDAIISSSGPIKKQQQPPKHGGKQNAEFPALTGDLANKGKTVSQSKPKPSKSKKEEEAVQRLFQSIKPEDDFTQWCERQLRSMDTTVDIPTFIAFLQEVDSPYEVHDYVRSYLGEGRKAEEFGKAFLEKRSQYRNKTRHVEEDSIWGPAPAITPKELRQASTAMSEESGKSKASRKKKNKMSRVDASILGFTVHAAPDRIVGEIDKLEVGGASSGR